VQQPCGLRTRRCSATEGRNARRRRAARTSTRRVGFGGEQIRGSGVSLEAPGPLLTHLRAVYMEHSECLPTPLNPLAESSCFFQVGLRARGPFSWTTPAKSTTSRSGYSISRRRARLGGARNTLLSSSKAHASARPTAFFPPRRLALAPAVALARARPTHEAPPAARMHALLLRRIKTCSPVRRHIRCVCALSKKISVFWSSSLRVVPISPNASYTRAAPC
jgi:hypothetical protein